MAERKFCGACRRLFSGDVTFTSTGPSIRCLHHSSVESLNDALSQQCPICCLAWKPCIKTGNLRNIAWDGPMWTSLAVLNEKDSITEKTSRMTADTKFGLAFHLPRFSGKTLTGNALVLEPILTSISSIGSVPVSVEADPALAFLIWQYRKCRKAHIQCNFARARSVALKSFPTRLIDTMALADSIVLLSSTVSLNADAEYLCLSHCWGITKPYTLTTSNLRELEEGIEISSLPRTFRDAIDVTRTMGIRYIWIDCLCIVQDDPQDWSTEAGRMAAIYTRAAGTIAATSSHDSRGGLFLQRASQRLDPIEIQVSGNFIHQALSKEEVPEFPAVAYRCDIRQLRRQAVEEAPLNTRAWVNQERQLSSRIMHFTDAGVFWECHEAFTSEGFPAGLPSWAQPHWAVDALTFKTALWDMAHRAKDPANTLAGRHAYKQAKNELYYQWCVFRIRYTDCDLTKDKDKLVALKGIADFVSDVLNDVLVAGLWKSRLSRELCWFKATFLGIRAPKPEPVTWRAPSWSWASSNAMIWVSNTTKIHRKHGCMASWIRILAVDVDTGASGELRAASLQVECRLVPVVLRFPDNTRFRDNSYSKSGVTITFDGNAVELRPDVIQEALGGIDIHMDDMKHRPLRQASLVIVQHCDHDAHEAKIVRDSRGEDYESRVEGLILVPCAGRDDTFTRIGLFTIYGGGRLEKMVAEHVNAEERNITLI